MRTTWMRCVTRVVAAGRSRGTGRMMHSALGVRAAAVLGAWPMAARETRTAPYAGAPERSLLRFLSIGGPIVASQKSLGAAAATLRAAFGMLCRGLPCLACLGVSLLPRARTCSQCACWPGCLGMFGLRAPLQTALTWRALAGRFHCQARGAAERGPRACYCHLDGVPCRQGPAALFLNPT